MGKMNDFFEVTPASVKGKVTNASEVFPLHKLFIVEDQDGVNHTVISDIKDDKGIQIGDEINIEDGMLVEG